MRMGKEKKMNKEYIEREKAIEWFMAFVHMGESDIPAETVISDLKYAIPAADVAPVTTLNELTKEIHDNAVAHGWWDEPRNLLEIAALCHSELSEAVEERRC